MRYMTDIQNIADNLFAPESRVDQAQNLTVPVLDNEVAKQLLNSLLEVEN